MSHLFDCQCLDVELTIHMILSGTLPQRPVLAWGGVNYSNFLLTMEPSCIKDEGRCRWSSFYYKRVDIIDYFSLCSCCRGELVITWAIIVLYAFSAFVCRKIVNDSKFTKRCIEIIQLISYITTLHLYWPLWIVIHVWFHQLKFDSQEGLWKPTSFDAAVISRVCILKWEG